MIRVEITAAGDGMSDATYVVARLIWPDDDLAAINDVLGNEFVIIDQGLEVVIAGLWEKFQNSPDYDPTGGDEEFIEFLLEKGFEHETAAVVSFHMTR